MAVQLLERRRGITVRRERGGFLGALRHLDLLLIAAALALTAIGLVMVYTATRTSPLGPTYFLKHQAIYAVLGVLVMLVAMVIDYHRIEEWGYVIYGGSFLALLAVRAVGHTQEGAAREITVGPLAIQPSEFAVLSLIIVVAMFIHRHEDELGPRNLAKLLGLVLPPVALVYLEPDLGTTIITFIVFVTMMVVGGVRLRYLGGLAFGLIAVFLIGTQVHILHDYQIQRLTSFLHQDDCGNNVACQQLEFQVNSAKVALGAGGLEGTGLLHGAVTNTGFVPFAYADMIFSAVGEQLGFLGATVVLGLFGVIALRMFRAIQTARDTLGRLLCAGALAFVVFSVFQNVGMNIGIMPITGIPLPFMSYGGSALFATFASIGLVANVEMRRSRLR